MKICLYILSFAILALLGAAYGAYHIWHKQQPIADEIVIDIPKGDGVVEISNRLHEAGIIQYPMHFAIISNKFMKKPLQAGEYTFSGMMSPKDIYEKLAAGKITMHRITIKEGMTSSQVVNLLYQNKNLVGEIVEYPIEGSLLPDTYVFPKGKERREMIAWMQKEMQEFLQEHWEKRAENLPIKSKEEALILASIVEKETGIAGERGRIAAVFINRLNKGMKLQADPTVIYGITLGKNRLGRSLKRSDLHDKSNVYSTYVIAGLPPTPIANPSREAILATLNPDISDELFFVADGKGGHNFSKTYAEHNRNIKQWVAKLESKKEEEIAEQEINYDPSILIPLIQNHFPPAIEPKAEAKHSGFDQ
jgi:UPF0755 protein